MSATVPGAEDILVVSGLLMLSNFERGVEGRFIDCVFEGVADL